MSTSAPCRVGPAVRLPRRPHHDPPAGDHDRLVEVAPAVGPVVGDLGRADLDQPVAGRGLELGHARAARPAARRSRTRPSSVVPRSSSTPPGDQLEQLGEHALGELGPAADREPDHASPSDSCRRLARSRWLRESLRGTIDVDDHVLRAAPAVAQRRQAEPLEPLGVPGLGAGGDLHLALAVERRDGQLAADHRQRRRHLERPRSGRRRGARSARRRRPRPST